MSITNLVPRGFGYLSLGLGTAQVVAPGALNRLIGVKGGGASGAVMRAIGLRELAAGTGLSCYREIRRSSSWHRGRTYTTALSDVSIPST